MAANDDALAAAFEAFAAAALEQVAESLPELGAAFEELAPPEGVTLKYGTAGFRTKAELLDSTFLRMGALAAIRSRCLGGAAVGLMVTASHNAEPDNGIKMVDPDGGMLDASWEVHAYNLTNATAEEVPRSPRWSTQKGRPTVTVLFS